MSATPPSVAVNNGHVGTLRSVNFAVSAQENRSVVDTNAAMWAASSMGNLCMGNMSTISVAQQCDMN